MPKYSIRPFVIFILTAVSVPGFAQKSTELFIPIGESPGLSGKYTLIGTIQHTYSQNEMITMKDSTGESYRIRVTDSTKIYLDRSQMKMTNITGTFRDCQPGALAEVYYGKHPEKEMETAKWIKVKVTEPEKP